jgi:hypothetical protein
MRRPLRQNRARAQTAQAYSLPAPLGGWDTESPLPAMKPDGAVILDNWIPRGGKLEFRRGFVEQCTGTADPVETLIPYKGDPAGDKLFAASGAFLYDVSAAGALPSAAYASAETARWNFTNFANDAGRWAILANGAQQPLAYNGSTFTAESYTYGGTVSFDQTKLKYVFAHKARLHFIQADSLRVWNPAVNAIAGAVTLLDLGPVFTLGGVLVGGARLTLDGGVGPDDFACYVTSAGQVAIYQGTDPSDATNWALVGVYTLPRPVGDRCVLEYGADVLLVTEVGLLSLSTALKTALADQQSKSLSRRISTGFSDAASSYRDNFGWSLTAYAGRGSLLIVNVPTAELSESEQFVRCGETGGWCRFTGIDAICWGVANGNPYFGSTLGVYRWDTGASDNGEPIVADVLPAFSAFGNRTRTKDFTMVRALMRAPAIVRPALQVVTDFDKSTVPTAVQTVVTSGDISPADATDIRNDWTGAAGSGYYGAPRMRISLTGADDSERVAVTQDLADLLVVGPAGSDHILTRPNLPLDVQIELIGFDLMYNAGGQL